MNKRNGCLFLAALLAFSVSGCKGADSGKDDLRIYGLLPTEKYMRDAEIARGGKVGAVVCRHEKRNAFGTADVHFG